MRYLAAKARREDSLGQKRKAMELEKQASERIAKKARSEQAEQSSRDVDALKRRALGELEAQLAASTRQELDDNDLGHLAEKQKAAMQQRLSSLEHDKQRADARRVFFENAAFADDWDVRMG